MGQSEVLCPPDHVEPSTLHPLRCLSHHSGLSPPFPGAGSRAPKVRAYSPGRCPGFRLASGRASLRQVRGPPGVPEARFRLARPPDSPVLLFSLLISPQIRRSCKGERSHATRGPRYPRGRLPSGRWPEPALGAAQERKFPAWPGEHTPRTKRSRFVTKLLPNCHRSVTVVIRLLACGYMLIARKNCQDQAGCRPSGWPRRA